MGGKIISQRLHLYINKIKEDNEIVGLREGTPALIDVNLG